MNPRLTRELRQAIDDHDGCVEVEDAGGKCILMSMEVFRTVMGVGTDRELQDSVAALQRGYDQFRQGRTRLATEALDELGNRHGLSR